jgi:hypothetical protein
MIILPIHPCGTSRVLLHAVKPYDMGPSRFTSHLRGRCVWIFIVHKNPSPWPGFEPATFGSNGLFNLLAYKTISFYNLSFIIVCLSLESRFSFVPFVLYILTYMFILLDCYIPVLVTCVRIGTIHVDVLAINSQKSDR